MQFLVPLISRYEMKITFYQAKTALSGPNIGSTNGTPNPMHPVGALCVTRMEVVAYRKRGMNGYFDGLVAHAAPTHMPPLTGPTHIPPLTGLPIYRP